MRKSQRADVDVKAKCKKGQLRLNEDAHGLVGSLAPSSTVGLVLLFSVLQRVLPILCSVSCARKYVSLAPPQYVYVLARCLFLA